ncbi:MAG TPA: NAD(P)-dependent oxidoreductase [Chthoniobacterales bacterium]|jgi:nucleoside-diphosphate-sugar epimerase|nr:NAD(P)-dependent oxidoreductase [Chthoniobacterales bacterium]
MAQPNSIFVTGGTGYIGSRLTLRLLERGHRVKAIVRQQSSAKLPPRAGRVFGDPLRMDSYTKEISPADTFIHLIGTPHPSPAKAKQFREIDLVSVQVATKAAREAGVRHFVYLSVAHPAPAMKAFIAVREQGEALLRASGLSATFVRPWYVLGPGHWWPYAILPIYWVLERIPSTRESAQRLGLITIGQMVRALVWAVENPPEQIRILGVPEIRKF